MHTIEVTEKTAKMYRSLSPQDQDTVIARIEQIVEEAEKGHKSQQEGSKKEDPFLEWYKLPPEERPYTYEGNPTESVNYKKTLNDIVKNPL